MLSPRPLMRSRVEATRFETWKLEATLDQADDRAQAVSDELSAKQSAPSSQHCRIRSQRWRVRTSPGS